MNFRPASSKIVLTTFGSFGDVHPYLAIGRELKSRGHHVVIATCELYRGATENAGLEFFPIRPDLPDLSNNAAFYERVMNPISGGAKYLLQEIVAPNVRQTFDDLCETTRDADIFVSHSMSVVAPLVAAQSSTRNAVKMRWISAIVSPMFLQSVDDPPSLPIVPALANVPVLGKIAVRSWNRWLGKWLAQPLGSLKELRREFGLPESISPLFDDAHSPHRVLGLFSPALAPPQKDWPPQIRATGFCLYDRDEGEKLSAELQWFLSESAQPPILFTLGASSAMSAGDFWTQSLQAVRLMKRRAIFVLGRDAQLWPKLDFADDIFPLSYVPLSQVLPHCEMAVHHGGIGTIALCLQAAKPMLIMPHSQDQPDNALRTQRCGVARLLPKSKYKASRVAHELQRLSSTRCYAERAQIVGAQIRNERGTQTACDWIENELEITDKIISFV